MTTTVINGQTVILTTSSGGGWVIQSGGTLIVSAGGVAGDAAAAISVSSGGLVNGGAANGSAGFLVSGATISNSGTMEASGSNSLLSAFGTSVDNNRLMQAIATGSGGFAELNVSAADIYNNSATISAGAAGSGAQAFVNLSGSVHNSGGKIIASGVSGQATIDIDFGIISGGSVGGIGSGAKVGVFGPTGSGAILDATILSGTFIGDAGGLTLSGDTLGAKNKIEAFDGGTALLSNVTLGTSDTFLADRNGNLFLRNNGAVNFGAGTTVQALGTSGASGFIGVSASSIGNLGNVQALASGAHTSAEVDLFGSGGITNGATIASIANGFAGTFAVVSALAGSGSFVNSGTVVASGVNNNATGNDGSDAGVVISAGANVSNTKTIEALANSNGSAFLDVYASGSLSNGAAGVIMASAANESVATMYVSAGGTLTNLGAMRTVANNSYASGEIIANDAEETLKFEYPTGSGRQLSLEEIAHDLRQRLVSLFLPDQSGRRPATARDALLGSDPQARDLVLFHEYFHGDTGAGLGASHQTGWTALVATLISGGENAKLKTQNSKRETSKPKTQNSKIKTVAR